MSAGPEMKLEIERSEKEHQGNTAGLEKFRLSFN